MNTLKSLRQGRRTPRKILVSKQEPVIDLVLRKMATPENPEGEIPQHVTLVRPHPANRSQDQLFIDKLPIPREAWSYDNHDRILRWSGHKGGGELHLAHQGRGAVGMIGNSGNPISVTGGSRAQFLCSVAKDCGATYETSGGKAVKLLWDTNSSAWKNANWVKNRLLMTYSVTQDSPLQPPNFTFEFEDKETEDIPWDPTLSSFQASLQLGLNPQSQMIWNLVFKSEIDPPKDTGKATGPDSVYPYWLQAVEDASASNINGVLEIDDVAPAGVLVGMQGTRVLPSVAGYYQTSPEKAPFAIFHGALHADGKAVAKSRATEDTLHWSGLSVEHQKRFGLPESGSLNFATHGNNAKSPNNALSVRRLNTTHTLNLLGKHKETHPTLCLAAQDNAASLNATNLTIQGLLAMSPFGTNAEGAWQDVVQEAVRNDLGQIMNAFVPDTIWKLLFPNTPKPTLSAELTQVAHSPVSGVDDPIAWYQKLGTAVMTQGMSNGSDENCKNMNGPRAGAWLQQEVANSPVYQAHSQLLFAYEWAQRFPLIGDYLNDQIVNGATYAPTIDTQTQLSIKDIEQNVSVNASSPADMKQKLKDEVNEADTYAKSNNLYWAFAFYTWNTAPAILANIAIQMGIGTGSSDGTTLTRLFQQNIAVLTALDPSGFFAKQYNKTINTFMCSNILPSMYGFTGDADDFTVFKEYLQEFVKQNINNESKQIAEAAAQIQAILADKDADEILKNSVDALRTLSESIQEAMSLPYVANRFVKWFETSYPRLAKFSSAFGTLVIGGLSVLAVFNIVREYKEWNKLKPEEKAELILESCQFGLQLISAVMIRSVRVYAIYSAEGLTAGQRFAGIFKALGGAEDLPVINTAMQDVSSNMARWIGDTAGSYAEREAMATMARVGLLGEEEVAEVSWTVKIFGKNLNEFIATRVGPLLILAGMGLSIYMIATGESGLALGADICNLISGAFALFAIVGGWFIVEGATGVLATMVAIAGPLAIIAALVGVALMIYEMFQTPPDPVKEFVDTYVKPAGFYVANQCGAIDYAISYAVKDTKLLMMGFQLAVDNNTLLANSDGTIASGAATNMPSCVWGSSTDGYGLSQICAQVQTAPDKTPVNLLLSLMSDYTISFQEKMKAPDSDPKSSNAGPTVLTQTWLFIQPNNVVTTSTDSGSPALQSLQLVMQPVTPDAKGKYSPTQAKGYLVSSGKTLAWNASVASPFTLKMAGLQPNYMTMTNPKFIINTQPSTAQSFGPNFGTYPSSPLSYAIKGGTLPPFLNFDTKTGKLSPNGQKASTALVATIQLWCQNILGSAQTSFTITVS